MVQYIIKTLAIALAFPAVACGREITYDHTKQLPERAPTVVDTELQPVVGEWLTDCGIQLSKDCGELLKLVDSITITEGYDEDQTVGRCMLEETYGGYILSRRVTIRRDMLKAPFTLKALMTHELGHCVFLVDHYEGEKGIMNSYIASEAELKKSLTGMLKKFYQMLEAGGLPKIAGVRK